MTARAAMLSSSPPLASQTPSASMVMSRPLSFIMVSPLGAAHPMDILCMRVAETGRDGGRLALRQVMNATDTCIDCRRASGVFGKAPRG